MTGSVGQTNTQATVMATAAEQASAGMQTVPAAAQELSASIGKINRQVITSARMTDETAQEARRTDSTVRAAGTSGNVWPRSQSL